MPGRGPPRLDRPAYRGTGRLWSCIGASNDQTQTRSRGHPHGRMYFADGGFMVIGAMDKNAPLPREPSSDHARPGTSSIRPSGVPGDGAAVVVHRSQQRPDPNALTWPPARSDVVAVFCFIMAGLLLYLQRSDWMIAFTLACGVFSGLSPRALDLVLRAGPGGVDAEFRLADPLRTGFTNQKEEEPSVELAQAHEALLPPPEQAQLPQGRRSAAG